MVNRLPLWEGENNYFCIMKKIKQITILMCLFFVSQFSLGQKLTFAQLEKLCNNRKEKRASQFLSQHDWTYAHNKNGETVRNDSANHLENEALDSIQIEIWSQVKALTPEREFNDSVYVFLNHGRVKKISYYISDQDAFEKMKQAVKTKGYTLQRRDTVEGHHREIYYNNKYVFMLATSPASLDNTYECVMTVKSSSFDHYNGVEKYYFEGTDKLRSQVTLVNGIETGPFTVYYENGQVHAQGHQVNAQIEGYYAIFEENGDRASESEMSAGKINGVVKNYKNNKLIQLTHLVNDIENGKCVQYSYKPSENWEFSGEYVDGVRTGTWTLVIKRKGKKDKIVYEMDFDHGVPSGLEKVLIDDKQSLEITTYKHGKKTGPDKIYSRKLEPGEEITMDTTKLFVIAEGNMVDGMRSGLAKCYTFDTIHDVSEPFLSVIENYVDDQLNGQVMQFTNGFDSLVIVNVVDNVPNDRLYIYSKKLEQGERLDLDTAGLSLMVSGYYNDGLKSGLWHTYTYQLVLNRQDNDYVSADQSSLDGQDMSLEFNDSIGHEYVGFFDDDMKTGIWNMYYIKVAHGKKVPNSRILAASENYENGELNGKSKKYLSVYLDKYPCSGLDDEHQTLDTCTKVTFEKIHETTTFLNGVENGPHEWRDSLNNIVEQGNYTNGEKTGPWIESHRVSQDDARQIHLEGSYVNGWKEGHWITYFNKENITSSMYLKHGKLEGKFVEWNEAHKLRYSKDFTHGELNWIEAYDTINEQIKAKFEFFDRTLVDYKCRVTEYPETGKTSQVFRIQNDAIAPTDYEESLILHPQTNPDSGVYKEGDYTLYNQQGQLIEDGQFLKGEKVGSWTYTFPAQDAKLSMNYDASNPPEEHYYTLKGQKYSGQLISINREDKLKEQRTIVEGSRTGLTRYIDIQTGKTVREDTYLFGTLTHETLFMYGSKIVVL